VNLHCGEVESERGHTVEASVGFIGVGAGMGTGLALLGAVRAGSSAGACSGAPERVEHVGVCFCLCSNVCRDHKCVNLAMSLAQISSWRLGLAIMCESQWEVCLSECKSSAGWQSAPALNPKMRRGLSVLLVSWKMGRTREHTRI
jgi:hypothetical protein